MKRNEECKEDLLKSSNNIISKRPTLIDKIDELKPQLKDLIRRRIDELAHFIFPINEIQSTKQYVMHSPDLRIISLSTKFITEIVLFFSSSLTTDSQEDIKNELAEATRTAYVRGRWVFTDSWGETQHSIVAPTLPDSGDYSPYIHWGL